MKILFFLGAPNPFPGAGWARTSFFAKSFLEAGHRIETVGFFSPKSLDKAGSRVWERIRIFNICPTFWMENVFSLSFNILSSVLTLVTLFMMLRPDIVIVSVPSGEPSVGAYLASRLIGARVIFDYRDEWEDYTIGRSRRGIYRKAYRLLKTLMTKLYMRSDLVVVTTEAFAHSLALRGVRDAKVVPNGADVSVFKPYNRAATRRRMGLHKEDFAIIHSGGIGGYYRLDVVITALAKLKGKIRDKVQLLIMGEGPDLPRIMAMANKPHLRKKIHYLGLRTNRREVAEIISASDVGIIPYDDNPLWRNSLPAKTFEFCACGIPVVAMARRDSILSNLIRRNKLGVVTPPLDSSRLCRTIGKLYKNASFRKAAGKRARLLAESAFDRNKIAKEFLKEIVETWNRLK